MGFKQVPTIQNPNVLVQSRTIEPAEKSIKKALLQKCLFKKAFPAVRLSLSVSLLLSQRPFTLRPPITRGLPLS
jgi:hypothetical protein